MPAPTDGLARGIAAVQAGLLVNTGLALVKLVAGVVGHSYALIADAIESFADIFASLVVWRGLRVASRGADDRYPFGYGRAEPLAAAIVGALMMVAALGIAVQAVREVVTPHHAPAPFTLAILVLVVAAKETLFRTVLRTAQATGSAAVGADAWHHRSDAITSAAAFVGISVALLGGPGWEGADDVAALFAAGVILVNASRILRPAAAELMDRAPAADLLEAVTTAAQGVAGVRRTEKLRVRKVGTTYQVDLHVQADPVLSLRDAHVLSGMVKGAIRRAVPSVSDVLVHMEPFTPP
jgi:cation diffusion facilitator family transporter